MNKMIKTLFSIAVIALGVFMFVYAGIDDSPGGQLIGVVVSVFGLVYLIKSFKR
jgi:hypothetical protein